MYPLDTVSTCAARAHAQLPSAPSTESARSSALRVRLRRLLGWQRPEKHGLRHAQLWRAARERLRHHRLHRRHPYPLGPERVTGRFLNRLHRLRTRPRRERQELAWHIDATIRKW